MGACEDQGSVTDFSGDRGAAFCVRCLGVLFLLTPLLSAQNPDELLAVRLPATQGYISRHPTPLPFPPGRGQTATPSRASKCGSSMASRPSGMARAADNRPGHQEVAPQWQRKEAPTSPPALKLCYASRRVEAHEHSGDSFPYVHLVSSLPMSASPQEK